MKNNTFLIILLALGLVFMSYKWITSTSLSAEQEGNSIQNAMIGNILTRTSVRSYTDEKVSEEQLDTLLRAAMAAPTAGNKQPWRFVVINDTARLNFIADNFNTMTMARKASVAVIMCGDTKATFEGEGEQYWVQDVSAATENLLLAAHAMGLGAVWCGIYPISERVAKFSEFCALPDSIIPMACVCIGYPEGTTTPKEKWNPDHIRLNDWNTKWKE